jgi:hypothetical protein
VNRQGPEDRDLMMQSLWEEGRGLLLRKRRRSSHQLSAPGFAARRGAA